jgi:TonB-linked SusC/RagA family outer membrane protein
MKKIILQMLLVIASVGFAQAQTRITGKVVDMEGKPLDVVSISVKEVPTAGALTDGDGNYTLNVPSGGSTLVFSYIGYVTQEVAIGSRSIINITLESDATTLEASMIVAYGTAKKASITGSVAQVSGEKLEQKNQSEVSKALAGEVAGVQVINSSGQPGATAQIRIRGYGTASSSNRNPLYVVDGVPFDGDISAINPADIESTSVLKDASASALYGSRASNGVILITTKKGNKKEHNIDVDIQHGVNIRLLPLYDVIQVPERYVELGWESLRNYSMLANGNSASAANQWASHNVLDKAYGIASNYNMWNTSSNTVIDPITGLFSGASRKYTPESWSDHMFTSGSKTEASVKFSGGSENLSYFTSFGGLKEEGYYVESGFDRLSGRTNLEYQPKSWLKATTNLSYTYMEYSQPGQTDNMNNGFQFVNYMPAIYPVYVHDADGNVVIDPITGKNQYDYGMFEGYGRGYAAGINPVGANQLDIDENIAHQIAGNVNFEISFLKDFKFKSLNGFNYLQQARSRLENPFYGDAKGMGRIRKTDSRVTGITTTQMLSYFKRIDNHSIDAFVAHEASIYKYAYQDVQKQVLSRSDDISLDNAVVMSYASSYSVGRTIESYFGQIRYDYDEKYFLNFNLRRDGSSRFVGNNRWGNFMSVGAAWLISKENFMSKFSWIDNLRLKLSYGTFGNENIDVGNAIANYYPTQNIYSISNVDDKPGYTKGYLGNPALTWEKSNMLNAGVDFRLWDRFDGEIEIFKKTTTDMLFNSQVPTSLGYASITVNDAQFNNTGIEFNFNVQIIKTKDINLDFNVNGAHYKNRIVKMPKGDGNKPKILEDHGAYYWAKDHSIYDYYIREYAGVNPTTGVSQWYAYYDNNNLQVAGDPTTATHIESLTQYLADRAAEGESVSLEKKITDKYADATLAFVGKSAIPDISGGFGLNFRYKNFTFNAQFVYSVGGYGLDAVYASLMHNSSFGAAFNWHKDIEKRWIADGQITDVPRLSSGHDTNVASTSTRFLTSNTYLGLNNIRLSYTFPHHWLEKIKVNRLTIWVSADNLYYSTAREGYLPIVSETGQVGRSTYIPLSTIMGGIKLQF